MLHQSRTSPLQRVGSTAQKGGAREGAPPGDEEGAVSQEGGSLKAKMLQVRDGRSVGCVGEDVCGQITSGSHQM